MRYAPLLVISCAVLGLTACNTSSDTSSGSPESPPPTAIEVPSATTAAPEASTDPVPTPTVTPGPIQLAVRHVTVQGVEADIVTINGWTAYRFEADGNKPSKVNCGFDCLITWPPALTDGSKVEVSGIDPSLVGTVGRPDRTDYTQVTLGGWPLYKFQDDKVPTDLKGEGVGGNWSVIKADGKPVIKKAAQ
ncbi:hypothetical protein [Kribbella sp. NPDC051770]|uniref:hypothetical protein n=1 Tax=Kribbella sp. NPDC051770 TaxID=3155413 RepID=UPI00343ECF90